MTADAAVPIAVLAGAIAATVIDLRIRRVPNVVTGAIACAGLALAAGGVGGLTVAGSLGGGLVGLLLMLPGHIFGKTGAGDVKLLAAMGTLLGPSATVPAFLVTAIAGGVLAICVAARRAWLLHSLGDRRFAYAPAIAIGTVVVALRGWGL